MTIADLAVRPDVLALRPDFAVLAVVARGLGRPTPAATALAARRLAEAETAARAAASPPPHIDAWHDAYRAFGAKPQRTPSSVAALWRRAVGDGLPRVHPLVDLYNAVSVRHSLPVGGEDLNAFAGPLHLIRAAGTEPFDTVKDGVPVVEQPEAGEVVWADELGVTCRRWNWRQGNRTRLREDSTDALFLFERLGPCSLEALGAAADSLIDDIVDVWPAARVERRLIGPSV